MILTTTPNIEGKPIRKYLGIITGEAIMGANIVRDFFAADTDIVGGRSGARGRSSRTCPFSCPNRTRPARYSSAICIDQHFVFDRTAVNLRNNLGEQLAAPVGETKAGAGDHGVPEDNYPQHPVAGVFEPSNIVKGALLR